MPTSVIRQNKVWDVVVTRPKDGRLLIPVYLSRYDSERKKSYRVLLCQVVSGRFGWTVVVAGWVHGPRSVDGFKSRWKAIQYAISIRDDLNRKEQSGSSLSYEGKRGGDR